MASKMKEKEKINNRTEVDRVCYKAMTLDD